VDESLNYGHSKYSAVSAIDYTFRGVSLMSICQDDGSNERPHNIISHTLEENHFELSDISDTVIPVVFINLVFPDLSFTTGSYFGYRDRRASSLVFSH